MLILKQLILGLLLPAGVSCGFLLFARALISKAESDTGRLSGWLIAAALGVGYITGYLGLEGVPPFPPREGVHWLGYLGLLGVILAGVWHFPVWGRLIVQAGLSIVIPRLLLASTFKYTWGQLEGIIWWACLAVTVFVFWSLVQRSFTSLPAGASAPFVYFGISGGTALTLAVSGSLRVAQHTGVLVAIFAATWIVTFFLQRRAGHHWRVFPNAASPVVALLLAGIWMNGYFYEEVPAVSAVLLVLSPCLAPFGHLPAIQNLGARRSQFAQIAIIALPVIIAMGIAVARSGLFGESSGY